MVAGVSVPFVFDTSNGQRRELPRDAYYALGRIDPEEVVRYSPEDSRRHALRSGHYGPWGEAA